MENAKAKLHFFNCQNCARWSGVVQAAPVICTVFLILSRHTHRNFSSGVQNAGEASIEEKAATDCGKGTDSACTRPYCEYVIGLNGWCVNVTMSQGAVIFVPKAALTLPPTSPGPQDSQSLFGFLKQGRQKTTSGQAVVSRQSSWGPRVALTNLVRQRRFFVAPSLAG